MPDELDDLLRRAIKTLDDQLPSGYFDTLSSRTLARLESSMETGTADHDPSSEVPPSGVAEEDSGLHDIRSLARSTKERISSKRIPLDRPSDEDLLATSSASWKAVALPEPAKMVSLPSVEDLPSARAKHAATSAAVSHPSAPVARRSRYLAFTGAGVLAAAAVAGFVLLRSSRSDDVARENAKAGSAAPIVALGQPIQPPAAAAPAAAPPPAPPPTPTVEPIQPEAPRDEVTATPPTRALMPEHKGAPGHRAVITTRPKTVITKVASGEPAAVATDRPAAPAKPAAKQGKDDTSDPSFDALLKEAGVDEPKKPARPKLDKKELSGDDFKRGMDAVAARAQACYKGTTGTAAIKLKIDPSGKITSVKVTGAFAGKPEGDCVSAAVKGASFPPWDGSPESFSYSYLLTE